MKYCPKCGNVMADEDEYCAKCGAKFEDNSAKDDPFHQYRSSDEKDEYNKAAKATRNEDLIAVIKVLMIAVTVMYGIFIIPLAWMIPMTVTLNKKLNNHEKISTEFKICVLFFCGFLPGILLLVDNNI